MSILSKVAKSIGKKGTAAVAAAKKKPGAIVTRDNPSGKLKKGTVGQAVEFKKKTGTDTAAGIKRARGK